MKNDTALSLMRMALGLYDHTGEGSTVAACHLQSAIDAATGAKPLQTDDELDPDVIEAYFAQIDRHTPCHTSNADVAAS